MDFYIFNLLSQDCRRTALIFNGEKKLIRNHKVDMAKNTWRFESNLS